MMKLALISIALLTTGVLANPLAPRQSCPNIHVFGARETTAPAGYGTAGVVVNLILAAHSGATSEAINYPACGGQSTCGSVSYASSVQQGITAVVSQVTTFANSCPSTQIVLVGYSQGGQIMDDALCGGSDTPEGLSSVSTISSTIISRQIKAAIFMGDPRYIYGLSYEVGTCTASGFAARPAGFSCPYGSMIQSYCDASDPYCCNGSNTATHQGYGTEYGTAALAFVNSKLSSSSSGGTTTSTTTTATAATSPTTSSSGCSAHWGQCAGQYYSGPTCCVSPYTCTTFNPYYSQCL